MHPRIGWGQPPTGWDAPGWAPLVDPGPLPLRAANSVRRWWWPTLAIGGFLAVVVQVLDHDDPAPGLSHRGLLIIGLAAAVVALLTIHRRHGPGALARTVAEYAVVVLLAILLAAPDSAVDQQPANRATGAGAEARAQAASGDDQPGVLQTGAKVVRAVTAAARAVAGAFRWLVDLWRQADQQAQPTKGEAMAASLRSPPPSALSAWRSP
jgi:hypothetical protein